MRILSVTLLVLLSLCGLWASTQLIADRLGDPRDLGTPWIHLGNASIYAPWAWLGWSRSIGPRAPGVFRDAAGLTSLGLLAGFAICAFIAQARTPSIPSRAYGSSRWATRKELQRAGLLASEGVILCQTAEASFSTGIDPDGRASPRATTFGQLVRHDGPEHVFCFAPTRSGKGAGLVIPTLLAWKHSVLVYDIKKENWTRTAGWRRQFSRTWRFEPTAMDSVRFNPLFEIRRGLVEVKDTQNVADILVDPTGDREMRDHWQATAHSLLVGAILHVLYAEPDKTLAGVGAFLADPARSREDTLQRMLETDHVPSGPHPVVVQTAREMLNKSSPELSGVFSTALACLSLYRDPVIARNTSESDFRIADLVGADFPVSLYLVVPPSDLVRTRPLMRLMLNQIGRRLTESMEYHRTPVAQRRLLLLLDEFPALGRLDFFETSLAFIASYGIKALLIAQSLNQLEKAYGPNNSILDNCHVRLTYAANDERTAKRISDLLGQATEKKVQPSRSGSGIFLTHRTESEHEYGRPLLTAAEVTQLPGDDALLFVGGVPPIRARKIRYYIDPRFESRSALPAPNSAQEQALELPPAIANCWRGFPSIDAPSVAGVEDRPCGADSHVVTAVTGVARTDFVPPPEPVADSATVENDAKRAEDRISDSLEALLPL